MFGYSKAEALGMSIAELIDDECREFHAADVEGYLRTEITSLLTEIHQISCRRRDGSRVRLELTLSAAESDGHRFYTAILREPPR
jgi:PAS domain S-box-containing protein